MINEKQRKYLIYRLYNALEWIGRSDDWQQRSLLVVRVCGIIKSIGETEEAIFQMDVDYLVTEYSKFRKFAQRLNDVIDIEDREKREDGVVNYFVWLHDIGLLRPED